MVMGTGHCRRHPRVAGANQWVLCPVKLLPGDEAGGRGAAWAGEKVPALKPGAPWVCSQLIH